MGNKTLPRKMYKTVNWKTGPARARYNLKLKTKKNKKHQASSTKHQAPSFKPQAPSKKVLDSHKIPDIK